MRSQAAVHEIRAGSRPRRRTGAGRAAFLVLLAFSLPLASSAATPALGAAILQDLRSFNTVGSILHVAAHPDDENTALITYFARGRGYRTAYLSLTRGDGGQNEIGPEFDEKLGLARTHELLAARKLDGGRQFFTRAIDFGYSKTPEETLRFWDRDEVLSDVVRIIRRFRPDVIVTRFPIPPGSGGHGHHTASGILAVEAFKRAGEPSAFPEQLQQGLSPWQPKRVVWNGFSPGRGGASGLTGPTVTLDIGGNDPVTGEPFGAIAARSRAMHITQGFASYAARGGSGPNEQSFVHLAGEPAATGLFDGIDTAWTRYPGGGEIGRRAGQIIAAFNLEQPSASVPALLELRQALAAMPADPVVTDKREQLDRILQACLGLVVHTAADRAEVVPGETLPVRATVSLAAEVPVRWTEVRAVYPRTQARPGRSLRPGEAASADLSLRVPAETPLTQPYWLREEGSSGIARVSDPRLIGAPENPPAFPINYVFEVGGQTLVIADEPVHVTAAAKGERRRRVEVIPPVSLRFAHDVSLLAPGASRPVTVAVAAARPGVAGTLRLDVPAGWRIAPASQPFRLGAPGESTTITFTVTAPAEPAGGRMTAQAQVGGRRWSTQRVEINYPHLPLLLLQPAARARLLSASVETRGRHVGYLPGAGDDTAAALEQLGYAVRMLTGADLTPENLRGLDAVVLGVRAFNERKDLAANLPGLFAYVESGGTVIAQYNRPTSLQTPRLGPYELSIAGPVPRLRVTDEASPVTFLAPGHPVLTTPNRISPSDFAGWVQERGAYFPSEWDRERYVPILAMNDPGEPPLESGLLVARHGRGHYVYTGLAFFRQLPAGVPGAYRLLANLVSLGP
jgi:LmbE family N-acetylglucosaminyl deacetylase